MLKNNIKHATEQFGTEIPLHGYKKIVKVKLLNPNQPEFNKTGVELKSFLQTYVNELSTTAPDLLDEISHLEQIRIKNGTGTYRFRVQNTVVALIP